LLSCPAIYDPICGFHFVPVYQYKRGRQGAGEVSEGEESREQNKDLGPEGKEDGKAGE
jgi:hypothetical protein